MKYILLFAMVLFLASCGGDSSPQSNEGDVVISGENTVGSELTSVLTDPDGIDETTIAYQWRSDDTDIDGARSATYTLTALEIGTDITLFVRYTDERSNADSAVSNTISNILPNFTLTATISKGLVVGAVCEVFAVDETGELISPSIAFGTTNNLGQISVENINFQGPTLVSCSGGTYSDEATDAELDAPVLRAVFDSTTNTEISVTPLSEAAIQLAASNGLSNLLDAIELNSQNALGGTVNGESVSVDVTTVIPTNLQQDTADDSAAGRLAVILALLSQLDADSNDNITQIITTFANDGFSDAEVTQALVNLSNSTSVAATNITTEVIADVVTTLDVATNSTGEVTITGTASVGQTLFSSITDANGVPSQGVSFQWFSGSTAIAGATSASYVLTDNEVGTTITLQVNYTDEDGFNESITSNSITDVLAVNDGSAVVITGELFEGSTLTAIVSDEDGIPGTINYQWAANGIDIDGATQSTFLLTPAQIGLAMTVNAIFTDGQGFAEDITSAASVLVGAVNGGASVSIVGVAQEGETLTADVVDPDGLSSAIAYQWFADNNAIAGATERTFVITAAQVGQTITVRAIFTDAQGFEENVTSSSTLAVVAVNSAATVEISGTIDIGETLSASVVDSNGATGSIAYQWFGNGTAIAGATNQTFTITSGQTDQSITVNVVFTDDQGFEENITSAATSVVGAVNSVGSVSISATSFAERSTLSAVVSDDNGVPAVISYQWSADGTPITGATDETFTLTEAQIGTTITVTANYTDEQGFVENVTSSASTAVLALNDGASVTISGDLIVEQTLTATVSDPDGVPAVIAYQWFGNDVAISGATEQTFTLTSDQISQTITVNAVYTDEQGFEEDTTSEPTTAVTGVNSEGTVAISGELIEGSELTATVSDDNGATGVIAYQWSRDGVEIPGATEQTYTSEEDDLNTILSVVATYTDDAAFAESAQALATDVIFSVIVTGGTSLQTALADSSAGDVIGVGSAATGDDYIDVGELFINSDELTLRLTVDSTAVISGATCVAIGSSRDAVTIDGLVFDDLTLPAEDTECFTGSGSADASILIDGTNHVMRNVSILSERAVHTYTELDEPYHYIAFRGEDNTIERSRFVGKNMDLEGSVITMFTSSDATSDTRNTIQYNLFESFLRTIGGGDSSAHAIQLGRSNGSAVSDIGDNVIQFNRFDRAIAERRLINVRSTNNTITGNTVIDSTGLIALEGGRNNTVTNNYISQAGDDGDDGGISFAPLGHTITNNYIESIRTTSSQRAALVLDNDPLSQSGNSSILSGEDDLSAFTTVIANNTITNARQPFLFVDNDCDDITGGAILDMDANLIANGDGQSQGSGRNSVLDNDFLTAGCTLSASSTFENNRFYSQTLSDAGSTANAANSFDFGEAGTPATVFANGNFFESQDDQGATGATLVEVNGLQEGSGVDAGTGADADLITILTSEQVGPGSTFVVE